MNEQNDAGDELFVKTVSRFHCLLDKGKTRGAVDKKSAALLKIQKEMESHGVSLDGKKIRKKLSNMKSRLKVKTDLKKTGNKKIVLKKWEEELLRFLGSEYNPTFNRVSGSQMCGVKTASDTDLRDLNSPPIGSGDSGSTRSTLSQGSECSKLTPSTVAKKPPPRRRTEETIETVELSNAELQRLVLLEQLKFFRTKNCFMMERQAERRPYAK